MRLGARGCHPLLQPWGVGGWPPPPCVGRRVYRVHTRRGVPASTAGVRGTGRRGGHQRWPSPPPFSYGFLPPAGGSRSHVTQSPSPRPLPTPVLPTPNIIATTGAYINDCTHRHVAMEIEEPATRSIMVRGCGHQFFFSRKKRMQGETGPLVAPSPPVPCAPACQPRPCPHTVWASSMHARSMRAEGMYVCVCVCRGLPHCSGLCPPS